MVRVTLSLCLLSTIATAEVAKPQATRPAPQGPSTGAPRRPPPQTHELDDMDPFAGDPGPPRPVPPKPVKPAPEVATLGKSIGGTWSCKGNTLNADHSSTPVTGTIVTKLDLDNAWISSAMTQKNGIKLAEFKTYDAIAKQWTRVQMQSTSGYTISTSLGEKDGKWTWQGTATSPTGSLQVRDYEQLSGKTLKLWGEALLGGQYNKVYEVTCTK